MNLGLRAAVTGVALFAGCVAARAEVVHTIWEVEPPPGVTEIKAMRGDSFFGQRLLPIRMVRMTDPALDGEVPAGTMLYLVYNDAQQIGFCTVIDRSAGKAAKGLFMPLGNKRPCFTDSDQDGKFDATFQVFDLLTSPPKVGGSIAGATPMSSKVGFEEIDRHLYPEKMRMVFNYEGKAPEKIRVGVAFEDAGSAVNWQSSRSEQVDGKWVVPILNARLWIMQAGGDLASFRLETDPTKYIQRVRGGIRMIDKPAFLQEKR